MFFLNTGSRDTQGTGTLTKIKMSQILQKNNSFEKQMASNMLHFIMQNIFAILTACLKLMLYKVAIIQHKG